MTPTQRLDAALHQFRVELVTQVLDLLENRWPLDELGLGLSSRDPLADRIRRVRGKLHNCDPTDWTPRWPEVVASAKPERGA